MSNTTRLQRPWANVALIAVLIGLPLCACLGSTVLGLAMVRGRGTDFSRGDAVAIVYAEGAISSGTAGATSAAGLTPARIKADLRRASADPSVKAIVLRINSPGGSVVASNEIYKMLVDFDKPIVVSMGEMAASGGYYIACASKWIVANPDTITGSIGVITEIVNVDELAKKVGVNVIVIKTGPIKDIDNPFRPMTDEEKQIWQTMIGQAYDGFVQAIVTGRKLPEDRVRQIGDGRVYSGRQAKELGLVDQLGYLDDAVAKAAQLGGIQGKPRVIEYQPRLSLIDVLMSSSASGFAPGAYPPALSLNDIIGLGATPRLEFKSIAP